MKTALLALLSLLATLGALTGQEQFGYPPVTEPGYAPAPGAGAPGGYPQQAPTYGYGAARQAVPEVSDQAAVIDDMSKLDDRRIIKLGDVLSFRIVEEKTPSKTLRVMSSGEVLVPHVGLVVAKDQTMKQFAYIVKRELEKEYFKEATVIVALNTSAAERRPINPRDPYNQGGYVDPTGDIIVVFGQVGRQGRMNLPREGAMTISTAILQAGGFARFANKKKVRIYRTIPGDDRNRRVIMVDVDRIMRRGDLNKDIELRPDDVIIVPEKLINL